MELEIITPKKKKNFEPVTIQLTIQTPEEFATLLAVANCTALDEYLAPCGCKVSWEYGVKMSEGLFNINQLNELKSLFKQHVTNQSK